MTNTDKTPGYSFRLTIKIAADKNGRMRATYWSMRQWPHACDLLVDAANA